MNWSQELLQSAIWLGEATAITLVASLLLGVALARTTVWGRQFWRLAAPFFTPRVSGWSPLLSLGAILLITLAGVRVNVLFSRWYNDMYSALQQLNVKLFWASMLIFGVLAAVHVGRSLLEYYLRQVFAIHWRESLNEYFLGKWLDKQGYYRSQHLAPGSLAHELAQIAPGSRYPICITHTKPAETELIVDEIRRFDLAHRHDLHWLAAGQTFEL